MNWKRKLKNDWGLLGLKYKPLSDIANYVIDRIEVDKLTLDNYISTENMISNKGGVGKSAKLPRSKTTASYKKGDVLISNIRPYFKKIWFSKNDGGCSNDILVLRAKEGIHPEYLYYVLSNDSFFEYATATSKGTKMPRGDKQAIMKYRVPDISLDIQIKIADMLSTIDALIYENNKINENLEQQALLLFKSWFLDYEPWNGNIPNSWICGKLNDFTVIKRGSSPRPIHEYLSDTGLRWLKISDVTSLKTPYITDIKESIIESGLIKTVLLKAGSLVLSNSATPGIPKILDVDSCIHDGWLYFPESKFSNEYLYLYFKYIRQQLINFSNGSVFNNLKTDILKEYPTILPDEETLRNFDNLINPIFLQIKNLTRESLQLSQIRDALSPKLMSGEIDISGIDV